MEEKKLSEIESLELISKMISSTRKRLEVGSGNQYLYWGYFTSILSLAIYLLVYFTHNSIGNFGWFLMFAFWGLMIFKNKGINKDVVTYSDKVLSQVWMVIGWMFVVTVSVIAFLSYRNGYPCWILMLPLSLMYCGIGSSITGVIIREPVAAYTPLIAFAFAVYMLVSYFLTRLVLLDWYLYYAISFVVMMVIPGHIINRKAKQI